MKVLVVVDAQNDFITGSLGSPEAERVLPNIVNKIHNFNGFIVGTLDTHQRNYLDTQEGHNLSVEHCIMNTEGWCLHDDIISEIPYKNWTTVLKETFGSSLLPQEIEDLTIGDTIEEIELIGYVLDICVINNALLLKAYFPETKIAVDVSCCSATSFEAFEAAKIILKSCQVEIRGE